MKQEKNQTDDEIKCMCPFRKSVQTKNENKTAENGEKIACPESITIKLCNQFCNPQKDCMDKVLLIGRLIVVILFAIAILILVSKINVCTYCNC